MHLTRLLQRNARAAVRALLSGSVLMLTTRGLGTGLLVGAAVTLATGGAAVLPIVLGASAGGSILFGCLYAGAAIIAMRRSNGGAVTRQRFKPLIAAAQASAFCGFALTISAIASTEIKKDGHLIRADFNPASAPAAAHTIEATPSRYITRIDGGKSASLTGA